MSDGLHAFGSAVAKEVNGLLVQIVLVGLCCHHVSLHLAYRFQRTVVDTGIYFHSARINHRTEQGILLDQLSQQHGHTEQFQRRYSQQLQPSSIADALCH